MMKENFNEISEDEDEFEQDLEELDLDDMSFD